MLDTAVYGLEGKVAIVTGSGAGIGKGIALEMAKAGANIVVAEIDPSRADTTVGEIRAMGNKALKVTVDATKSDQVDKMIQQTLKEFGTIDILVNNVGGLLGIRAPVPFLETSEDFWDDIINLNLKGTFLCSKAFAKAVIDQEKKKRSIINTASMGGIVPCLGGTFAYGCAKAGVIILTRNMALALGKYNIRVNAIAPGLMETEMTAELYRERREARQAELKQIPLGRFGLPADVGKVAVFLASDAAGYVSGDTIVVAGGLSHLPFAPA